MHPPAKSTKRKEEEEKGVVDTACACVWAYRPWCGIPDGMKEKIGLDRGGDDTTTSSPSSLPLASLAKSRGVLRRRAGADLPP